MRLLALILALVSVAAASSKLDTIYEWKYIDYLWESDEQKDRYVRSGDYNYENIVPIDVDKARDGRVFVTAIRNNGVPASLAVVTDKKGPSGPLLRPYPNWSWYTKGSCDSITSVYRVAIDECNKMYVLDTGYIGSNYTCPAQVLIFDLDTDTLVRRIKIPDNVSQNKQGVGKLVTPVIEFSGPNCKLESLFMADVNGKGLAVITDERIFRLEATVFEPVKPWDIVEIAGESFELADSLMGMAISPKVRGQDGRDLYFRPFASLGLYAGDTRVLSRSIYGNTIRFKKAQKMLPSQGTAMGISSQGTLFMGLTKELAIACWNRYRDMSKDNLEIVAQDENRLQFASGLKVLPSSRTNGNEEVWVLTNRLQKAMTGTRNFNEINFRVLRGAVDNLIRNTKCERPNIGKSGYNHINNLNNVDNNIWL